MENMLSKEEAKGKVLQLTKEFSEYSKEKLDAKSEDQIRSEFIDPLFEALGWNMRKDAEREERVLKGRADYILRIGNQESLVIEAKGTDIRLSGEDGWQAVSYAYHRKIKFAVLTNFKYVRVYHSLSNIKNVDKNLLFWLEFKDFEKEFDNKLWLLSKESFEKGELKKLIPAKDERQAKSVDVSILQDLLEIREILSKDLKNKRIYLSSEKIDEAVQILIDRLIFMRSAEDRGLENMNFLLGIVKDFREGRLRRRLWDVLEEEFKRFDKDYNSKLFAHSILENEKDIFFDDDTLVKVIRILYFGYKDLENSRYMFDEIPGDLLGSIYEQYLGVVLRGTEKRVKLDLESGKRKKMGIYYTPSYIVDYIVKNTVGEYIKDKTIDEILEVNIVDPACGSGSFLIRAFQEVCNIIEEKLKKGEKSKSISFKTYNGRLNLAQKSAIMKNCIHGVDLDEKAVELAQLNLLLKILEEESRDISNKRLPNLLDNIKNGNSLIDDSKVAGDKAFNWHAQFPDVFRSGGFDVVIGNPPWVSIKGKQKSVDLSKEELNYLLEKYPCDKYRPNLFEMFIWKSLELVKLEGYFGFIVPDRLANNLQFKNLREVILKNKTIKSLWFRPEFEGVISDNIIFTIQNKKPSENSQIKIAVYPDNNFKEVIQTDYFKTENLSWTYADNDLGKIFDKIKTEEGIFVLGEKFETKVGFIAKQDKITENKTGQQIKVFKGRNILRYGIKGSYFFDFKKSNLAGGTQDREKLSKKNKVFLRKTGDKIIASFDNSGTYPEQSVYFVYTNEVNDEAKLKILCAILNSKLLNVYYWNFAVTNKDSTPQLKRVDLNNFPIKLPPPQQEKHIISLVGQILSLQKQFHEESPSGREKERLEQQIKNIDYEIDQEIYNLYGLTKDEIKIIEESLN